LRDIAAPASAVAAMPLPDLHAALASRSEEGFALMMPHRQRVARTAAALLLCAVAAAGTRATAAGCEDATTSAEMLTCASRQYAAAEATLEKVYRRLAAGLPAPRRAQLETAQKAWTAYRDAQAAFAAGVAEDGTLYPILQVSEQAALAQARIEQLREAAE
jgi:uncharacterized protein YecT (DUF1311 family)